MATMRSMTKAISLPHLRSLLSPVAHDIALRVVAETGSTNADLLAALPALEGPTMLVTDSQTAGRGRAGRTWLTEPGAALTFSLAWKFDGPLQTLVGLPLAVGVVIAEVLAAFDIDTRLKWPNDVLRDGDKLAGILIETDAATNRTWAVIGIGINLAVSDTLAQQIARPVAAARTLRLDRERLLAALLDGLAMALARFASDGFAPFAPRWNRLHAYAGELVAILDRDVPLHEGVAAGVDETGRLLLDTADGRIAVMAGDVSLRKKEA